MPAESTKRKALDALDNMRLMVKRGRLKHEGYISPIQDEELHKQGAICDGRNYCMLGTAWVAYGVQLEPECYDEEEFTLPGVEQGMRRDEFLRHRPGLKLLYDALNQAARRRLDRLGFGSTTDDVQLTFRSEAESYFEDVMSRWNDDARERRAAYSLFNSAQKIIETA